MSLVLEITVECKKNNVDATFYTEIEDKDKTAKDNMMHFFLNRFIKQEKISIGMLSTKN